MTVRDFLVLGDVIALCLQSGMQCDCLLQVLPATSSVPSSLCPVRETKPFLSTYFVTKEKSNKNDGCVYVKENPQFPKIRCSSTQTLRLQTSKANQPKTFLYPRRKSLTQRQSPFPFPPLPPSLLSPPPLSCPLIKSILGLFTTEFRKIEKPRCFLIFLWLTATM